MLSYSLRIFLAIALVVYFFMIIIFLKKKSLSLRYTLLWIFAGVMMGIFLVFPQLLDQLIAMVGIKSTMNGLFALSIFFLLILCMTITSIVSKQSNHIKSLAQNNAFLEKRIRELEKKIDEQDHEQEQDKGQDHEE